MSVLIDDLLELARVSRLALRRETISLDAIAESVADDLRRHDPERSVRFEIESGLETEADDGLVRVMLENLLGNAWKFTSRKSGARVQVGKLAGAEVDTFFVADDGAGFDMEYASKLFQPFSRLHKPSDFEGTGIGLATVQRIVARHGGRIWAQAAPDAGATFYFTLASET
jgi:signal transduction histidine kinase